MDFINLTFFISTSNPYESGQTGYVINDIMVNSVENMIAFFKKRCYLAEPDLKTFTEVLSRRMLLHSTPETEKSIFSREELKVIEYIEREEILPTAWISDTCNIIEMPQNDGFRIILNIEGVNMETEEVIIFNKKIISFAPTVSTVFDEYDALEVMYQFRLSAARFFKHILLFEDNGLDVTFSGIKVNKYGDSSLKTEEGNF